MARVWIEDRIGHAAYVRAAAEAKRAGRTPPGRYRVRWYDPDADVPGEQYKGALVAGINFSF